MSDKLLLMVTSENGLTGRIKADQERLGRTVVVETVATADDMERAVAAHQPDAILCPFLKTRVPRSLYRHRLAIVHPGVLGDRGAYSLDWAILEGHPVGGVTLVAPGDPSVGEDNDEAESPAEGWDSGPVWAYRTVNLPVATKSELYNTAIADAAVDAARDFVDNALTPRFVPTPQHLLPRPVPTARTHPAMTRQRRMVDFAASTAEVLRTIRAADGSPGALADLEGLPLRVYNAHAGRRGRDDARPGQVLTRAHETVEVATSDGSIYLGHARDLSGTVPTCKGPITTVLARAGVDLTRIPVDANPARPAITYTRDGLVGTVDIRIYNGAMSVNTCSRLVQALRHAKRQPTRIILLRSSGPFFSNGLHLGQIQLAADPATEAYTNLVAINMVVRELLTTCDPHGQTAAGQVAVVAAGGSAGAGGAVLAMAADHLIATERAMFTTSYRRMGLTGSEFHTLVLPRRAGESIVADLLDNPRTIDSRHALDLGLVDEILPNDGFAEHAHQRAQQYACSPDWERLLRGTRATHLAALAGRSLDEIESRELAQMSRDVSSNAFHDLRAEFLGVPSAVTGPARPMSRVA
ncbi:enoyl-CoA hydratase-related protein [Nocardia tengchongensis]|uniref:enoyl-CoA hydratase-related protein n=1 Tax=Nocardia tengchongensis TaxID=2055889 RepID=UPI0036644731